MQAAAEAQDTATSRLPIRAALGLGTSDQLVPSQRSARVTSAPTWLTRWPVAMHIFAETQDTASRKLPPARRLGLCTTDHVRVCALAGTTPPSNTSPVSTAPAGSHRPASEKRRVGLVDPPITQFKMPMTHPASRSGADTRMGATLISLSLAPGVRLDHDRGCSVGLGPLVRRAIMASG